MELLGSNPGGGSSPSAFGSWLYASGGGGSPASTKFVATSETPSAVSAFRFSPTGLSGLPGAGLFGLAAIPGATLQLTNTSGTAYWAITSVTLTGGPNYLIAVSSASFVATSGFAFTGTNSVAVLLGQNPTFTTLAVGAGTSGAPAIVIGTNANAGIYADGTYFYITTANKRFDFADSQFIVPSQSNIFFGTTNAVIGNAGVDGANCVSVYSGNGNQAASFISNGVKLNTLAGSQFGGTATAIAAGVGAGTTPTVTLDANANDISGTISVVAGTTPTAAGIIATVTYGNAKSTAGHVVLTPGNAAAAGLAFPAYISSTATGTFAFSAATGVALVGATTYLWTYQVIQ
jgi:hypothetical protein